MVAIISSTYLFTFLIGAYFVKVTLNLNNEKFDWTKFQHFWDTNFFNSFSIFAVINSGL